MDNITYFFDLVSDRNSSQKNFLNKSLAELSDAEKNALDSYIGHCLDKGFSYEDLAEAYLTIVNDTMREQMFFLRKGRYRYSSFDEVANSVYFNESYMTLYMHGLALTTYLWPNHLYMKRYFEKTLPRDAHKGDYLEIGLGHGLFFLTACKSTQFDKYLGVDISPTSAALTRDLLSANDLMSDKINIQESDFLKWEGGDQFDAIVMGEVLEHVEQPVVFLRKICELAKENAYIFVTTCINSPAVDHIYHYETVEQIEAQVSAAGMSVADKLLLPYGDLTLEESFAEKLPVNIAMVLKV